MAPPTCELRRLLLLFPPISNIQFGTCLLPSSLFLDGKQTFWRPLLAIHTFLSYFPAHETNTSWWYCQLAYLAIQILYEYVEGGGSNRMRRRRIITKRDRVPDVKIWSKEIWKYSIWSTVSNDLTIEILQRGQFFKIVCLLSTRHADKVLETLFYTSFHDHEKKKILSVGREKRESWPLLQSKNREWKDCPQAKESMKGTVYAMHLRTATTVWIKIHQSYGLLTIDDYFAALIFFLK